MSTDPTTPPETDVTLTEAERGSLIDPAMSQDLVTLGHAAERIKADAYAAGLAAQTEQTTRDTAEVLAQVAALRDEWLSWAQTRSTPRIDAFRDAAEHLDRALLAGTEAASTPEVGRDG